MIFSQDKIRVLHLISGDLWAGAESQAYTQLKYLQSQVNLHVVLLNDGELANRLRLLNIPVTLLPENSLGTLSILKKLTELIRQFKPAIIHTHRQKENILGALANVMAFPLFGGRAKSLRTTHGAPEFRPNLKQKLQIRLDNFVGKYLQQAVISVSEDLAKKLTHHFPPSHIHVIHNGVDGDALRSAAITADFKTVKPEAKHLGIVGRLEPVKRIDIFIRAAAILLKQQSSLPPMEFHVIGDGRLRAEMQELATSLDIKQAIHFHGHRRDMASCIRSLDAVVMCSDHEGTPMVALEALALGTAVIAHDVGGLHELLVDQPEYLVQDHAPEAYAAKILTCLCEQLSTPFLPQRYKAEVNAAAVVALYQELLSAH